MFTDFECPKCRALITVEDGEPDVVELEIDYHKLASEIADQLEMRWRG